MDEFKTALAKFGTTYPKHRETESLYLTLLNNLKDIYFSDCPDGYIVNEDVLYILEHFEFDSSLKNRKGSKSRSEQGRVNRGFESYSPNSGGFHDSLDIYPTADDYINNALDIMNDHINKIPSYRQNLKDKNLINSDTIIKLGFYIEDTTRLGNYQLMPFPEGLKPLSLVNCKQFIDNFEYCADLDFCFCASSFGVGGITTLFGNQNLSTIKHQVNFISKSTIEKYRNDQIDITTIDFKSFDTPRIYGEKIIIKPQF